MTVPSSKSCQRITAEVDGGSDPNQPDNTFQLSRILPAPLVARLSFTSHRSDTRTMVEGSAPPYQTDHESRSHSGATTEVDFPTSYEHGAVDEEGFKGAGEIQDGGPVESRAILKEKTPRRMSTIFLALGCALAVGYPVSTRTDDNRVLDGCMIWFVWIATVQIQDGFAASTWLSNIYWLKETITTLLNPVLWTTLGVLGYTRIYAKVSAIEIDRLLSRFSSGLSLADFLSIRTGVKLQQARATDWFGAGDAALSILDCGIVAWGFKLYECRQQLWSRAGAVVLVLSALFACLNVFISALLGRAIGLAKPEALAFTTRSTTLALARPAMDALGGNMVVNAAVVVASGLLGQLIYPWALRKLKIPTCEHDEPHDHDAENSELHNDNVLTMACGVAIGINGAAMGVAYLYARKSRAAPYAALAMTVFGVTTVVFTSIQPFTGILQMITNG
jgi:putative effector of murein hydrolase